MGEVQVGDIILSADGERQKVLAKYPHEDWKFNRITFSDGTYTEAGDEHLWVSWRAGYSCKKARRYSKQGDKGWEHSLHPRHAEVISTDGMADWIARGYTPLIPVNNPVRYETKYKPDVNPYLLGALLGDGSLHKDAITLSKHEEEDMFYEILDNLELEYSVKKDRKAIRFSSLSPLYKQLGGHGLIGRLSHDKFIPDKYLYMSIDVRQSLLQGLLDTDGYVCERGQLYYTTVSEELSEGFQQLVHSLGGLTTITTKVGKYRKPSGEVVECRLAYTHYVKLHKDIVPFRMERKLARYIPPKRRLHRSVKSIEYSRHCDGACITVSNPSRLYMTDNFIVTHNSFAALANHLKYIGDKHYKGVVVRRTTPMLMKQGAVWDEAKDLYRLVDQECRIRIKDRKIIFRTGAEVGFDHFERATNTDNWQGSQLSAVVMDELTHFEESQMWYLISRLRSKAKMKPNLRATMNPDPDSWVDIRILYAHVKLF